MPLSVVLAKIENEGIALDVDMLVKYSKELTEELIAKLVEGNIGEIETLYVNDLDQGAYIAQTLRADDTPDQLSAKVAIYRMMRPGEPPTEDSVNALFGALFYTPERYDLSAVGRMKFNRRAYPEVVDEKTSDWLKSFYEEAQKNETRF
jgi:DNA-directed RNA polymerase subunit beta